jgi:glycosyltransferase involved in cell wall biosynthesis
MTREPFRLIIVVPTRNRSELAMEAVRSVLAAGVSGVRVLVSDNSTDELERASLRDFCEEAPGTAVEYVRPPEPLSMTRHWDWAAQRALHEPNITHITFLTDRMVFRTGALSQVLRIAGSQPRDVVSYNIDRVVDDERPIWIDEAAWTGRLFRVPSAQLLSASAQSLLYHPALPKMLNSVVPRHIFLELQRRFGTIFSSISPDFNFCYRCLATVDSVLFYDRSVLFHYAATRSNGGSLGRGVANADHADFVRNLAPEQTSFRVPFPRLRTVGNAILHEYECIREETGDPRFPAIDRTRCARYLRRETDAIQEPSVRSAARRALAEDAPEVVRVPARLWDQADFVLRRLLPGRIGNQLRFLWLKRAERARDFSSARDLIAYSEQHQRPSLRKPLHLAVYGELPEEVPF